MNIFQRNLMIKQGLEQHGIIVHTIDTFSYTTGMANFGFPEIIITTCSGRTRGALCNFFFHKWAEHGVNLKDVEPMFETRDGNDVQMRFVTLENSQELLDNYVAQTDCFYEMFPPKSPMMFVHLQLADENDIFPDSPLYNHKIMPQKTFKALKSN